MKRVLKVVGIIVGVLVLLAFLASFYFLSREEVPATTTYALDLAELRRLAATAPGELPAAVKHAQVALGSLPRGAVFAGESLFTPQPFAHGAYQVVYSDNSFGIIDAGFAAGLLRKMDPEAKADFAAYESIQRALGLAKWIVITHEHFDHIGGIVDVEAPDQLVGRLSLTTEQLASDKWLEDARFPEALRSKLTPLAYDRYHVLAPGVVLVKAAGHTPGTQMIYVALSGGRELLFVGDVAWQMDQIRELWYRPRLVTDVFLGEDRAAVMGQLRKLHDLGAAEPALKIIVSHDVEQRRQLLAEGVIGEGFALP